MSDSSAPVAYDMYGHPIYPLGETGFGVSISFFSRGPFFRVRYPSFTVFHQGDNYRQALFSVDMELNGPHISNPFRERIVEHFANEMSPLGSPSLREVQP